MREVFLTFLRLGLTSFGGPIAHYAFFRRTFVDELEWLDEATFARILAFCSIIPGPTSSQVGMLVGFTRGGPLGAFLAWLGFTTPSALAMIAIAATLRKVEVFSAGSPPPWFTGFLDGLFAAAAAVVAQAVLSLARSLCTDRPTQTIALGATIVALALRPWPAFQWIVIALGALAGGLWLTAPGLRHEPLPIRVSNQVSAVAAVVFVALVGITLLPRTAETAFLGTIVRAGSLVFGGGHVVLPLLQSLIREGFIAPRDFFAGYGAVQALPGPINTFAAFLGYANRSPLHGLTGALVATVLIFLPSFALIFAIAPLWNRVAGAPHAAGAVRGANASVVGLLGAVLYDPVIVSLGGGSVKIGIALAAFAAVAVWRLAPWMVVLGAAVCASLLETVLFR